MSYRVRNRSSDFSKKKTVQRISGQFVIKTHNFSNKKKLIEFIVIFSVIQIPIHGCVYDSFIAFYSKLFSKTMIFLQNRDSSVNEPF